MKRFDFACYSNDELVESVERHAREERTSMFDVLEHLAEMCRRKLHRDLGFPSLFAYCTDRLGYCESAAGRRMAAARTIAFHPEVGELLREEELTLSAVCLIADVITRHNKFELLRGVQGKSRREVQGIVARWKPRSGVRERVVPVAVRPDSSNAPSNDFPALPLAGEGPIPSDEAGTNRPEWPVFDRRRGGQKSTTPMQEEGAMPDDSAPLHEPTEERFELRFSVEREAMMMLERARAIAPGGKSLEAVFVRMLAEYLERHDPAKKQERRVKREKKRERKADTAPEKLRNRHIPAKTRDGVFLRDGGRCTFIAPDGTRCTATHHLQVDHIHPFALGGTHELSNLRLLCGAHNRLEAERVFGAAAMRGASSGRCPA